MEKIYPYLDAVINPPLSSNAGSESENAVTELADAAAVDSVVVAAPNADDPYLLVLSNTNVDPAIVRNSEVNLLC